MDVEKLEKIRNAAIDHVQRCTPSCPSSTSCRYRRARKTLREGGKPCAREILRYRRFALEVTQGQTAFDLLQTANDTALTELLLDGFKKCQAASSAFAEEASKALRPGPLNGRPRQSVAKNRSRSQGPSSMRLTERKRILIDLRRALHHGATFASSPAHLSLTDSTIIQTALEVGKENIYDTV